MKFLSCSKKILGLAFASACCLCLLTTPHNLASKNRQSKQSFIFSESMLIKDAVSKIKKQLKQREGSPYFVSCTYKMHNNKPLEIGTKTYFRNYRKKPAYTNEVINANAGDAQASRIIEVTYNKAQDKNSISIIEKSKRKHAKASKTVDVSNLLKDEETSSAV